MPPKSSNGSGFGGISMRSFFTFILLFAGLSFAFLFLNYSAIHKDGSEGHQATEVKSVRVVLWDVPDKKDKYNTFLGNDLANSRDGNVHVTCPFNCTFTTSRKNMELADAVLFDPTVLDYDNWRRLPISLPHKQSYQVWVMTSYEHQHNYPLVAQKVYKELMDIEMTYEQNSDVPISLFCPWVDSFSGPEELLTNQKKKGRDKTIMFLSSNCQFSGASARTAYVEDLMRHIPVDSYGECLHTTDWDGSATGPGFKKMEEKLALMRQYKIVLAFENNNVSDYVTEKLFNVFQAGALPVYMGAPNVDTWLPGKDSIVKTSDFASPAELAKYLKKLLKDEKEYETYFAWKKKSLSPNFLEKYKRCKYTSACRLCEHIASHLPQGAVHLKQTLAPERPSSNYNAAVFNGDGDSIRVPHHNKLCVSDRYTLMAWVKPASFGDQRVIDKNRAGKISGFNFDIQTVGRSNVNQGFMRLCAGESCYMSKKGIQKDVWSHVAVVYSSEHPTVFENHIDFYLNGVLDTSEIVFAPTNQEKAFPLTFGKPASERDSRSSFHGSMDSVAIFNHDLSAEEIRKFMFNVPKGDEQHLLGFWAFDEPTDEKYAHDMSSFEYDGELFDGVSREHSPEKPLHMNKCH